VFSAASRYLDFSYFWNILALTFWSHPTNSVFHLEDIAIEIGRPLPALDCQRKIIHGIPYEGFDLGPEKARIMISNICRALVAE
jgi:hypothetical protein